MSTIGWHIARITIEAESPMSCGSGGQGLVDAQLVRDANGLPMIPGATLQGQLRSLYLRAAGKPQTDAVFGTRLNDGSSTDGKLIVGHGTVHDSSDKAVSGLIYGLTDALLKQLIPEAPVKREHVRLNERHVADDAGKFDRAAVPKGARFSFELAMQGDADDFAILESIAKLAGHPLFRPGAARARGYGRVQIIRMSRAFTPKDKAVAFRTLREKPASEQLPTAIPVATQFKDIVELTATLKAHNPWRIGSTGAPVRTNESEFYTEDIHAEPDKRAAPVKAAPTREPVISWTGRTGHMIVPDRNSFRTYVAPGSGIRGPLAHRMLYHWNRLNQRMLKADLSDNEAVRADYAERPEAVISLLGNVKEKTSANSSGGRASRLIVEDMLMGNPQQPPKIMAIDHNSIDRFTGGTRAGILYSEEVALTGDLKLLLLIDEAGEGLGEDARTAFCHALRDLCEGRLAIGAKSQGFFEGRDVSFSGPTWQQSYDATSRTEAGQ